MITHVHYFVCLNCSIIFPRREGSGHAGAGRNRRYTTDKPLCLAVVVGNLCLSSLSDHYLIWAWTYFFCVISFWALLCALLRCFCPATCGFRFMSGFFSAWWFVRNVWSPKTLVPSDHITQGRIDDAQDVVGRKCGGESENLIEKEQVLFHIRYQISRSEFCSIYFDKKKLNVIVLFVVPNLPLFRCCLFTCFVCLNCSIIYAVLFTFIIFSSLISLDLNRLFSTVGSIVLFSPVVVEQTA